MSTESTRQEIGRRLATVRAGIRRAQMARGALLVVTIGLGGLLAMMAADHFLAPLPAAARWAMFGVWLAAVLAGGVTGTRPLRREIGLVQVARWIEGRHPEIEERMSTVMELAGGGGGASEELLDELAREAGEDMGKVDARFEMKSARAGRRWAMPAAVLAMLLAGLFAIWPQEAARLVVRAVAPFSKLGNAAAGRFSVSPGNIEVLEGDAVLIEVGYDGSAGEPELVMELETGSEVVQPMARAGDRWNYRMDPVREGFLYRVRAGRGESDAFLVTTWPLPALIEPRVVLAFPEYTGLLPEERTLDRGIEAVRGTGVTLSGRLNTAVEEAWLEIGGERVVAGRVERSADGGRVDLEWRLRNDGSGEAVVWLKHRLGREVEALRFPVRVTEDLSPTVRWLSPMARELRVRPNEVIGLRYEVTEDFGVESLQLEAKAGGGDARRWDRELPEKVPGVSKPARYRGSGEVAVGELLESAADATEFRLRLRATDGRPEELGGPGIGHSEWLRLRIDRHADSLARQELRADHEEARETIEQAIRATREARERMDRHRGEMRAEELGKDAEKHFAEAREKLAGANEALERLVERMEESVHASKAGEVREASEMVAGARRDLEDAPLQDGPENRGQTLDRAREGADKAVKKLESVRDAMDRERQRIEELAGLIELAQEQRELARQAEEMAGAPQAEPVPQDWRDRQQAMEEALRRQLREQPQARADVLEAQAEEARRLAAEARELGEAQRGLETEARKIPADEARPEDLRAALAREQAKIAAETTEQLAKAREERSATADLLPQAVDATRETGEALDQGDDQAAAESAKDAVAALKESAESSGGRDSGESRAEQGRKSEIEALADRQEQVAGALEALAAGEMPEALESLQQLQAEAAGDLAEAIAEMPRAEGSGPMNEARDASRQGDEQARAAAESGAGERAGEAADRHRQAAGQFQRGAEALERAAGEFAQAAGQAKGQQADPNRPPVPAADLAEAFQAASRASDQDQAGKAADQAARAAEAMARAAGAARQSMQGQAAPGRSGPSAGPPGERSREGPRGRQPDPGVPPELAKLGISAADWEKIQTSLKSDVGARGAGVPEEYRGLVKEYFEAMSEE